MTAANYVNLTYYLRKPESRPNPYRLSPKIIFVDGILNITIDANRLATLDARMARYNAWREKPEWAGGEPDGVSEDEENRTEPNGASDPAGDVSTDGGSSEGETDQVQQNGETDQGGSGGETEQGDGSRPEIEPKSVKRLTKAEKAAGLTKEQAGIFRVSDFDDPVEWLEKQPVVSEDDDEDEDLV